MPKILGFEVRVVATKVVSIKAMVIAMFKVVGRVWLGPCYRCP